MQIKQLCISLAICLSSTLSHAEPVQLPLNSKSALVIDTDNGETIVDKNSQDVRPIASITKLMAAVVLLDAGLPLEEQITITHDDVDATVLRGRQTSGSLPVGTTLSRAELLHLALMNSNNRAIASLARTYPGGTERFIQAMNYKAEMLGMTRTKYVDPTGLFNGNISTAQDLAILVRHAYDYVLVRDFSTQEQFSLTIYGKKKTKTVHFNNTNRLVKNHEWNIVLQKTGFINDAGRCVVMLVQSGSKQLVIVLLNAVSGDARAADAIKIKHWVETGEIIEPVVSQPVKKANKYKKKRK